MIGTSDGWPHHKLVLFSRWPWSWSFSQGDLEFGLVPKVTLKWVSLTVFMLADGILGQWHEQRHTGIEAVQYSRSGICYRHIHTVPTLSTGPQTETHWKTLAGQMTIRRSDEGHTYHHVKQCKINKVTRLSIHLFHNKQCGPQWSNKQTTKTTKLRFCLLWQPRGTLSYMTLALNQGYMKWFLYCELLAQVSN